MRPAGHRVNRLEWPERTAAGVVMLLLVGLVVLPVARLVRTVVAEGNVVDVLTATGTRQAVVNTVVLAVVVALVAVPIGAAIALVLRRSDLPGRGALRVVVLLPLLV